MFSKGSETGFNLLNLHILILILVFFLPSISFSEMLSVKGEKVNLRSGPGKKYAVKWEYGSGYPLQVIRRQGKWVKVQDFEKDQGWIHDSLLDKSPHVIVNANKNSKQTINIRSGPGISYSIVGKAHYGVVFEVKDTSSGWAQIEHESGLSGWVKSTLLWGL